MKKKLAGILVLVMVLTVMVSTAAAFTPPGLEKKGGLPPGIQKRFLDGFLDKKQVELIGREYDEVVIKAIDRGDRRIGIEEGTAKISLLVSDKVKIYMEEKTIDFKDLQVNDMVYLKLDKDNTVTEIKVIEENKDNIRATIQGAIVRRVDIEDREIALFKDGNTVWYKIHRNATITVDGMRTRDLKDIKKDMKVDARIVDGDIQTLTAVSERKTYEGKLLLAMGGKEAFIILDINGERTIFSVLKDLNLSRVREGRQVIVEVEKDVVIRISEK
ncbi:hypothetical protein [Natronincola ferrireducens]|uniref:DUF5666 domain-containing protein n=1 Tax=Natronincola ferrireducens TaxID=393762 RepID=A0A1G9FVA2_9FIRM|nr:hypothetical protein [Natronincola ferrireducens]SDK92309.1 hypothetical protein SAMN05660472_02261 [Natronincola ferrireducens]